MYWTDLDRKKNTYKKYILHPKCQGTEKDSLKSNKEEININLISCLLVIDTIKNWDKYQKRATNNKLIFQQTDNSITKPIIECSEGENELLMSKTAPAASKYRLY